MAMILGKHRREDTFQIAEKRSKAGPYQPSHRVVQLLSTSREANLTRLTVLFSNMDLSTLQRALADTDNHLELSIQLLNRMSLDGPQEHPAQHAQELVAAFQHARSREDAVHFAVEALQRYHQQACEQEEKTKLHTAYTLRQQLDVLSKDNEVLKKAVVKLSVKLSEAEQKAGDNQRLREELQQERMNNYSLRLYLEQATAVRQNEHRGPDVF